MAWELRADRPIYQQISEKVVLRIISGCYKPGDRLPSVRELAEEAGVNPNTMQKALSELEGKGLVFSHRTSGRFITEDCEMIEEIKDTIALEKVEEFLISMKKLGITGRELIELLGRIIKEEK
ncbi:GntR family transcriptional regulator [Alloiococcus sp. CFN-8]|uniref:GntR family transcriptional regulator n=1 Tax=Alloiococcus sp. CFN-8 TaxID=3416081 RepID=UPI003CEB1704